MAHPLEGNGEVMKNGKGFLYRDERNHSLVHVKCMTLK